MICQECGMEIEGNEYHPYAFCVLVKANLNPLTVVLEAASQLITIGYDMAECDNATKSEDSAEAIRNFNRAIQASPLLNQ